MSFGVTNGPTTFMDLMNKVLKQYLDLFVIVFINDILIYCRSEEEHASHLIVVLLTLKISSYSLSLVNVSSGINLLLLLVSLYLAKGYEWIRRR